MPSPRFQKGNKFGKGRPRGGSLEWCREFADKEGRKLLLELASSEDEDVRLKALSLIFAYGHGKPTEHHEVSGNVTLEQVISEAAA